MLLVLIILVEIKTRICFILEYVPNQNQSIAHFANVLKNLRFNMMVQGNNEITNNCTFVQVEYWPLRSEFGSF